MSRLTVYATCGTCGRRVRVRKSNQLYRHLAKLATPASGGVYCTGTEAS